MEPLGVHNLPHRRKFASPALHLVLGCGQIALSGRKAILDYAPVRMPVGDPA